MTEFKKAAEAEVPFYATKYDVCTIKATGAAYKHQKGSGRSTILELAKDGMLVGALSKLAAKKGFDPKFTTSSLLKHHDTKDGAFKLVAPAGTTLEAIKSQREARQLSPEKAAEREKKAAEKAAAKQAKLDAAAKKKTDDDAAKAAKKEAAAAAKKAKDDENAAKKAAADAKKATEAAAGAKPAGKPPAPAAATAKAPAKAAAAPAKGKAVKK